jgi:hypothetical protein
LGGIEKAAGKGIGIMQCTKLWAGFAKGTAFAGLISASLVTGAHAGSVSITASPSGQGLSTNAPDFTFNGVTTSDFASIDIYATSNPGVFTFTEAGYLPVSSFNPGTFIPAGLNGTAGANSYQLWGTFSGSGTLSGTPLDLTGSFSSINFSLMGIGGNSATFDNFTATNQPGCTNCSGQTLATGALLSGGTNFVNVGQPLSSIPLPSAQVDLLFSSDDAAFFLAPPTPFELDLSTAFTNQSGITGSILCSSDPSGCPAGAYEVITIGTPSNQGGAGSGTFSAVPEPTSMAIVGFSLFGLGMFRRRRQG